MKTIKYLITTAIVLLAFTEFAQSQSIIGTPPQQYRNIRDFEHDPAPLMGPWRAHSGDMTYELSFVVDTVNSNNLSLVGNPMPHTDTDVRRLVGTMVYKRNGTVVKTLSPQSHPVYISVSAFVGSRPDYLAIYVVDCELDAWGSAILMFVEGSQNKKATWHLLQDFGDGDFDIPHELIFEKIPQRSPGGSGTTPIWP